MMLQQLRFITRVLALGTLTVCIAFGQDGPIPDTRQSQGAPHVTPANVTETYALPPAPFAYRPNGCLTSRYYNPLSANIAVQDSVPTQKWAVRMNLSDHSLMALLCTLWTVETNFRWQPKTPGPGDTLHIFMREVTPPYNEFYHVKYITRLGENVGGIEVDPPVPGNARPIVSPLRDVFVGMYITGGYGNQVTWRMKAPAQFNHSYIFVNPQNPVPATPGSVFGANGDLQFQATFCYKWIPVELSLFSGYATGDAVQLEWVTESETDSYRFEIQRRFDDGEWETRGVVTSTGTTRMQQRYSFSDPLGGRTAEGCWYRLRQMDYDGTFAYFGPIRISTSLPSIGYELHEAYPNPVRNGSGTAVRYELPAETPMALAVYDALGREAAVLAEGTLPAGNHEVRWFPPAALPNGTYYLVMRTPGFVKTRKLSLLR